MRPSRRSILAAVAAPAAGSLPGCVLDLRNDSSLAIHLEPVDRSQLGRRLLVGRETDEVGPVQRELITTGVPHGTVRYGNRPIDDGMIGEAGGSYYPVKVTEDGSDSVTRPILAVEQVESAIGAITAVGDLPE